MPYKTVRWVNLSAFILCLFLLGAAAYLQFHLNLQPCALCLLQRWILLGLVGLFLIGGFYIPRHHWAMILHGALIVIVSLLGIAAAGRQVWLQSLPADALPLSCGPDFSYLLENYSLIKAIEFAFSNEAECTEVVWRLFNLSIPEWTLLFFILFAGIGVWQLIAQFTMGK